MYLLRVWSFFGKFPCVVGHTYQHIAKFNKVNCSHSGTTYKSRSPLRGLIVFWSVYRCLFLNTLSHLIWHNRSYSICTQMAIFTIPLVKHVQLVYWFSLCRLILSSSYFDVFAVCLYSCLALMWPGPLFPSPTTQHSRPHQQGLFLLISLLTPSIH